MANPISEDCYPFPDPFPETSRKPREGNPRTEPIGTPSQEVAAVFRSLVTLKSTANLLQIRLGRALAACAGATEFAPPDGTDPNKIYTAAEFAHLAPEIGCWVNTLLGAIAETVDDGAPAFEAARENALK